MTTIIRNSFLVFLTLIFLNGCDAQENVVAIHDEPFHSLVYSQDNFRILDIQIPSDNTTLYHIHDRPISYVVFNATNTVEQIMGEKWPDNGEAATDEELSNLRGASISETDFIEKPKIHRVRNPSVTEFHLIAVINDADGGKGGITAFKPDDFTAEPFINKWFVSDRVNVEPMISSDWITAETDMVITNPFAHSIMLELNDDNEIVLLKDWQVIVRGAKYRVKNVDQVPAVLVTVGVRHQDDT